jgi:diacylglycerol kinase (ATP)
MSGKHTPRGSIRTEQKTAGESPLEHVLKASGYSLAGLGATLKLELAFRIEMALFVFLLPIAVVFPVSLAFKALIIGSMLMVLCVELLNSSLEWIVDYISHDHHPYAKRAKDMGSAAVMIALINCGLMWGLAILEWLQG